LQRNKSSASVRIMNAVEKGFSDEGTKKAGKISTPAGFCY
jgi:hypothetical protein